MARDVDELNTFRTGCQWGAGRSTIPPSPAALEVPSVGWELRLADGIPGREAPGLGPALRLAAGLGGALLPLPARCPGTPAARPASAPIDERLLFPLRTPRPSSLL